MAVTGELKPPFTLEQLATVFRQRVDDLPGDIAAPTQSWDNDDSGLLWSNEEVCTYADEAQQELARRKPILDTDITPAITQIAVVAATQPFTYDSRILSVDRIKFVETVSLDEHILRKRSAAWMDLHFRNWDLEGNLATAGAPHTYVDYLDERVMKLYPVPDLAGTLHLTVWRRPLVHLDWSLRHKQLEAQDEHHLDLLDWMMYRAYLKRDAETENVALAGEHKAIFDERIGVRPSARVERIRRMEHNQGRRVRAHYF